MIPQSPLQDFLRPLEMDIQTVRKLSEAFLSNFRQLAAHDQNQFLPTPISESILRPVSKSGQGRHLAIDIGGTNLRVGFIELSGQDARPLQTLSPSTSPPTSAATAVDGNSTTSKASLPQVHRLKEKSWPIAAHNTSLNTSKLFEWIGECIATVVAEGCHDWALPLDEEIPLGITFSFPMVQRSLSDANLMAMGKGFVIDGDVDLGALVQQGYEKARSSLPPIRIVAIANDSVSTLVSFIYMHGETTHRKGSMGLIVGTGCNATVPLPLSALHESKRPDMISLLPGERLEDVRIAVNTEWSINGTAPPLRALGLITEWDRVLDAAGEAPGFQPLEYMTSGRYLGELGRLMLLDYLEKVLRVHPDILPSALTTRFGITTTFLSHFKPLHPEVLLGKLNTEFASSSSFRWTQEMAIALYHISKAIQRRSAGIVSAGIVALLTLAGDIPSSASAVHDCSAGSVRELGVGWTGGCIEHFQDYLVDTQTFLDDLIRMALGDNSPVKVVLAPCHDGGIKGAGILAAAAQSSRDQKT